MSEHNYFALTVKAQMEKDPSVFEFDSEKLEQHAAKRRVERDAAAPPPGKADLHKEYNQLRQRLFDLQQNAKTFEIRTNEAGGKIRNFEHRINEALRQKREAFDAGNLRGERSFEHSVATLETELADAKEEFEKNKRWSGQAARALREFNQHDRIAELKALLSGPATPQVKP